MGKKTKTSFQEGKSGNPNGRPVGSRNKRTTDVLAMIQTAHNSLVKAKKDLSVQAKSDPKWFYDKIWSKIIPKDVMVEVDFGEAMMAFMAKMKHKEKHGAPSTKDD